MHSNKFNMKIPCLSDTAKIAQLASPVERLKKGNLA